MCILGYLTSTIWPSRHAAQFITIGYFDAIPGELRLKAYGTRIMISFLAVCLRSLCEQLDASQQTDELRLCSLMMTQLSNWNLDLENCPIDLTEEQAERLYATGMEHPAMHSFRVFLVISTPEHPALVYIYIIYIIIYVWPHDLWLWTNTFFWRVFLLATFWNAQVLRYIQSTELALFWAWDCSISFASKTPCTMPALDWSVMVGSSPLVKQILKSNPGQHLQHLRHTWRFCWSSGTSVSHAVPWRNIVLIPCSKFICDYFSLCLGLGSPSMNQTKAHKARHTAMVTKISWDLWNPWREGFIDAGLW